MASSALASGLKLVPPALIGFAAYVVAYAPMHPARLDAQAVPTSEVMILSEPDGATLLRDGKELGKAPLLIPLATGSGPTTLVARFAHSADVTRVVGPNDAADPDTPATTATKKDKGTATAPVSRKVVAPVDKKSDRKSVSRPKKKRSGGKEGTIDPFQ